MADEKSAITEIDPKDKDLMKELGAVVINGRDKQEYEILEKHPLVKGVKDASGKFISHPDPRAKVGDKHWAHPIQVEKWIRNGWVKKTESDIIREKMPEAEKKK